MFVDHVHLSQDLQRNNIILFSSVSERAVVWLKYTVLDFFFRHNIAQILGLFFNLVRFSSNSFGNVWYSQKITNLVFLTFLNQCIHSHCIFLVISENLFDSKIAKLRECILYYYCVYSHSIGTYSMTCNILKDTQINFLYRKKNRFPILKFINK